MHNTHPLVFSVYFSNQTKPSCQGHDCRTELIFLPEDYAIYKYTDNVNTLNICDQCFDHTKKGIAVDLINYKICCILCDQLINIGKCVINDCQLLFLCEDCLLLERYCDNCGQTDCTISCIDCMEMYCMVCSKNCSVCRPRYPDCKNCGDIGWIICCSDCMQLYCDACSSNHGICYKYVECDNCYNTGCMVYCSDCIAMHCKFCSEKCSECEGCMSYCSNCMEVYCNFCSEKCSNCLPKCLNCDTNQDLNRYWNPLTDDKVYCCNYCDSTTPRILNLIIETLKCPFCENHGEMIVLLYGDTHIMRHICVECYRDALTAIPPQFCTVCLLSFQTDHQHQICTCFTQLL